MESYGSWVCIGGGGSDSVRSAGMRMKRSTSMVGGVFVMGMGGILLIARLVIRHETQTCPEACPQSGDYRYDKLKENFVLKTWKGNLEKSSWLCFSCAQSRIGDLKNISLLERYIDMAEEFMDVAHPFMSRDGSIDCIIRNSQYMVQVVMRFCDAYSPHVIAEFLITALLSLMPMTDESWFGVWEEGPFTKVNYDVIDILVEDFTGRGVLVQAPTKATRQNNTT